MHRDRLVLNIILLDWLRFWFDRSNYLRCREIIHSNRIHKGKKKIYKTKKIFLTVNELNLFESRSKPHIRPINHPHTLSATDHNTIGAPNRSRSGDISPTTHKDQPELSIPRESNPIGEMPLPSRAVDP